MHFNFRGLPSKFSFQEVGGLPVADFQAYKGSKVSANKTKFKVSFDENKHAKYALIDHHIN